MPRYMLKATFGRLNEYTEKSNNYDNEFLLITYLILSA